MITYCAQPPSPARVVVPTEAVGNRICTAGNKPLLVTFQIRFILRLLLYPLYVNVADAAERLWVLPLSPQTNAVRSLGIVEVLATLLAAKEPSAIVTCPF